MDIVLTLLMMAILVPPAIFLGRWFANQSDLLDEVMVDVEKALSEHLDCEHCLQNMRTCRAQVLKKHGFSLLREHEKGCSDAIESDWTSVMYAFYAYYGERVTNRARLMLQV